MNNVEEQLRSVLRRCDPPASFADRVLERVSTENKRPIPIRWWSLRWQTLRWAAAVALAIFVALALGYQRYEQRKEEAQALSAKKQVMVALRITGNKLRIARQKVKAVEKTENRL